MYLDFLGSGLFRELAEEFGDAVFDAGLVCIRDLESRVDTNPESIAHVRSLGFRLLQDAQPIRARKCFETALALEPADFQSRIGMACALEAANRCQMAIEHLQVALSENPNSCMTLVAMGFCLERLGESDDSIKSYKKALDTKADLARSRIALHRLSLEHEHSDSPTTDRTDDVACKFASR